MESPYIANNIEYTRKAYNIDHVDTQVFEIDYNLTDLAYQFPYNANTFEFFKRYDFKSLLRRKEISNLLGVTKDILNLGEFSIDNISAWVNDNVIGDLLSSLHDSLIMHTPSVALSKGKLTAFEKVIDVVLDSSVSRMIYDSWEDHV